MTAAVVESRPQRHGADRRLVLGDVLPAGAVRDVTLVLGAVVFTSLMAQVAIRLPGNPVPITGQTFAVLLSAAAIGPLRSCCAQVCYLCVGVLGLPVFADHRGGWHVLSGATGGYLVGFVLASALVGWQARRGLDRRPDTMAGSFLLATALIYLPGVWWLAHVAHLPYAAAVSTGAAPFVLGDVLKAVVAGALVPAAWRFVAGPGARRAPQS